MIFAHVKLLSGESITLYARDHIELFYIRLKPYADQIAEVTTKTIPLRGMRQGRETRMEGTNQ
jgi:hypothetical protein